MVRILIADNELYGLNPENLDSSGHEVTGVDTLW